MGNLTKTEQQVETAETSGQEAAADRASAMISALKAALDKVYGETPEQELQRLIDGYKKLIGSPAPDEDGDPEANGGA